MEAKHRLKRYLHFAISGTRGFLSAPFTAGLPSRPDHVLKPPSEPARQIISLPVAYSEARQKHRIVFGRDCPCSGSTSASKPGAAHACDRSGAEFAIGVGKRFDRLADQLFTGGATALDFGALIRLVEQGQRRVGHAVCADIDETGLSQPADLLRSEWAMYRLSLDLDVGPGAQAREKLPAWFRLERA